MSKAIMMSQPEIDQWQREEHIASGPNGLPARLIARAKALGERTGQRAVCVYAGHIVVLRVTRHETQEGPEWRPVACEFIAGRTVRARDD